MQAKNAKRELPARAQRALVNRTRAGAQTNRVRAAKRGYGKGGRAGARRAAIERN